MPRRALYASRYLTTSVLHLSHLKTSGWVLVGQGELLRLHFQHRSPEQEVGLVCLPLFIPTLTTSTPHHPALTHHFKSAARCFVLHALHPVRLTLGYLSQLPCSHLRGAALDQSPHTRRHPAPPERSGVGDGRFREHCVAIHGLHPTR